VTASATEVEVSTPGDQDIVLVRSFRAPRELVWEALTTPDLLVRWYGARGWSLAECEVDLHVGGAWRFVSVGPVGERLVQSGVFTEVAPPSSLVATEVFEAQSYPGTSVISRDLVERGRLTTLTTTVRLPSRAARDQVLRYPMVAGFSQACERLAALVAGRVRDTARTERPHGAQRGGTR
jgi:uncharacterized protein YndB with AHSA1/START domain